IPPEEVASGPVEETVETGADIDVTAFPAPRWHENDGGRYIGTADVVITRNAETGRVNAATYRVQVHGPDEVTVYMSPGKDGLINQRSHLERGEPAPFVIVAGAPPILFTGANERISAHVNELEYVGGRLGEPIEVITGTETGLPIPARSELVLEGHLYPETDPVVEGPFGEWTGYYAGGENTLRPVTVERVYHRADPILTGIHLTYPDGRAQAGTVMKSVGRIWADLERTGIPGVRALNGLMPNSWLTVVAIDQQYPGHAKQVGLDVFSSTTGAYHGRFVLIVDDDIDVFDWGQVLWAMCSRADPERDIEVIENCWSTPLDPTIPPERRDRDDYSNSRAIIDATRPYHWREAFPETTKLSEELRAELESTWQSVLDGGAVE
ncbi:MAG: UbiD family decarboxylase, partial [Halobacteriales archaeon]|nr:UbiD family decarboxylase [Halobacteriales archaeon]